VARYDQRFVRVQALDVSKLLFFLLLAIAAYFLLRKKRSIVGSRKGDPVQPEAMVCCAYCGLHVPKSDALQVGGNHYCGEEHRRLDADGNH
jgi:uncharacterized protein